MRKAAALSYANWCFEHRAELPPEWTAVDSAATEAKARDFLRTRFEQCYPLHPSTLTVFQRKWRSLTQFQQTRGCDRVLGALESNALVNESPGAGYLERRWPEAFRATGGWPIKSLRQASLDGSLERLINPDEYLKFNEPLSSDEVSFDADFYLLKKERAEALSSHLLSERSPRPGRSGCGGIGGCSGRSGGWNWRWSRGARDGRASSRSRCSVQFPQRGLVALDRARAHAGAVAGAAV